MIKNYLMAASLLILLVTPNAFAFWPFDSTSTDPNKITIRQADSIITYDKTTNKGSWQTATPWIYSYTDYQGNPIYVPYNMWQGDNYITIENAQASITVNTQTCTLKVFDQGRIDSKAKPLLNEVSFNLQQSDVANDMWTESSANTEKCSVSYSKSDIGVNLNMIQGSEIEKNIEIRLSDNTLPELILKVKNNGLNSTEKYGFAVSISNSSNIINDGDLIDFKNDRNQTVLTFDTQNSINHYLWKIKHYDNKIILDYKNAKQALLPGDSLEIDPQFTANPSLVYAFKTGGSDSACTTYSTTTTSASTLNSFDLHLVNNGCGNSAARFVTTSFPVTGIVSSIQIGGSYAGSVQCSFVTEPLDPASAPGATLYSQIQSATVYASVSTCSNGVKVSLGSNAIANFESGLSNGIFSVGFPYSSAGSVVGVSSTNLIVNYTLPVPNSVTGLTCNPSQALGISCSWNNST